MDAPRTKRRRAAGLVGMLVLVGLIEAVVGTRRGLVDPVAVQWRYRAKAVRAAATRAEVLCLGDSLIRFGIDAPTLGQALGGVASNQAVLAAPAATTYFALRDALAHGARPRLVLVDFAPFLLLPGYRLNRAFLPEAAGLGACLDLAWSSRDPELAGGLATAWLLPSAQARDRLRAGFGWLARGGQPALPPVRLRRPDLWLPGNDEAVYDWFYNADWQPGAEHRAYLDRFLDLAQREGIRVAWLLPPVGPTVAREWDASGLNDRYAQFAATVQTHHRDLTILDARRLAVCSDDLLDPLHLNPRAARALTARVAAALGAVARPPDRVGWVDLGSDSLTTSRALPLRLTGAHDTQDRSIRSARSGVTQ